MRKYVWVVILLGLGLPAGLYAQSLPMQFAKWTATGPSSRIGAPAVEQLAGNDAVILREDGLVDAERRSYEGEGRSLNVTLYRMRDTSGAYAAFTTLRSTDMTATDLAPYSAINRNRALFLIGQKLMDVAAVEGATLGDLRVLVSDAGASADRSPYPTLGSYLPAKGKIPNSEKYVLGLAGFQSAIGRTAANSPTGGDWLGFGPGVEAALGRYRSASGESVLLLVEYPTPQVAAEKLKQVEKQFAKGDGEESAVVAKRKGSLLSMVLGAKNPASANELLDTIPYETQVTWNEPTYQFKEPSLSVMIVEAFVGTGIILMFAVIAGLGFGGVRLLTKYVLPGKVFDRQEHVEILQLGISSKPIEGRDFY